MVKLPDRLINLPGRYVSNRDASFVLEELLPETLLKPYVRLPETFEERRASSVPLIYRVEELVSSAVIESGD